MKTSHLTLLAVGLLVSLISLPSASSAQTVPFPTSLAGTYHGLLNQPGDPLDSAFGRVEVVVSSTGNASGKLILIDKKTYPFVTKLTTAVDSQSASAGPLGIAKNKAGQPQITLSLGINTSGAMIMNGVSTLATRATGNFAMLPGYGFKAVTYNATTKVCAWKGVYTATFSDPTPSNENVPTGSGYASGTIGVTGTWLLAGRLADGTSFTGSMRAGATARYFVFSTPYTLAGGYFASTFDLTPRSDGNYHVADGEAAWVRWTKMTDATTVKFGPVDCVQTCTQWKVPGTGQTVRSLMGLEPAEVFDIDFSGALDPVTYAKYIPTSFGINSNGSLRVSSGLAGSPDPTRPSLWSKFYSGKIDPKTGVVKITIKVTDRIGGTVAKPKNLVRSVTFNGVMFQLLPELLDTVSFVGGYTYTPPLPPLKVGTYGDFAFNGPIDIDQNFQNQLKIAGTYRFKIKRETFYGAKPSYTPVDGATITATISADLSSIIFGGRKLPLTQGGLSGLPADLVFSNAQTSYYNNQTIVVKINPLTNEVYSFIGNYIKNTIVNYRPTISTWVYASDGAINKVP